MNTMRSAIEQFIAPQAGPSLGPTLGGTMPAPAPPTPQQTEALKKQATVLRGKNDKYFIVCVAMIVALFIAELYIVLTKLEHPDIVKTAVAAFGVSTLGLITWMIRLWREKDHADTVIALSEALEPDDLRRTLQVLLNHYYPPRK